MDDKDLEIARLKREYQHLVNLARCAVRANAVSCARPGKQPCGRCAGCKLIVHVASDTPPESRFDIQIRPMEAK